MVPIASSYMSCYWWSPFSRFKLPWYWNPHFAYPTCICHWIWRSCRRNMETRFGARELESWGCHMVKIMIVGCTMWTQSASVTDRQTDWRTDLRWLRPRYALHKRRTVKKTNVAVSLSLPFSAGTDGIFYLLLSTWQDRYVREAAALGILEIGIDLTKRKDYKCVTIRRIIIHYVAKFYILLSTFI